MDLKLPILDGYEASKTIRNNFPKVKIIAQSAYKQNENEVNLFDAFLMKPIEKKNLFDAINKLF